MFPLKKLTSVDKFNPRQLYEGIKILTAKILICRLNSDLYPGTDPAAFFLSDLIFQQAAGAGQKLAQILKAHPPTHQPPAHLTSLIITFHQRPRSGVSTKTDEASNALPSSLWAAVLVFIHFLYFSSIFKALCIFLVLFATILLHRC